MQQTQTHLDDEEYFNYHCTDQEAITRFDRLTKDFADSKKDLTKIEDDLGELDGVCVTQHELIGEIDNLVKVKGGTRALLVKQILEAIEKSGVEL